MLYQAPVVRGSLLTVSFIGLFVCAIPHVHADDVGGCPGDPVGGVVTVRFSTDEASLPSGQTKALLLNVALTTTDLKDSLERTTASIGEGSGFGQRRPGLYHGLRVPPSRWEAAIV